MERNVYSTAHKETERTEMISMPIQVDIPWKEKNLVGSVHYPPLKGNEGKTFPLIIICHGFIGNRIGMDRLFVKAANHLANEGNIVIRFDYWGCGESEGEYGKTSLNELINQTIQVIDYSCHLIKVDKDNITLLGHSLGGATAVLTAARDSRVKRLILWAPVGNPFKDITTIVGTNSYQLLNKYDFIEFQGYHLYKSFFDSLGDYHPIIEAESVSGDVLLVHGTDDLDIPSFYSQQYYDVFSKRREGICSIKFIEKANHTFSNADHFEELIYTTQKWIKEYSRIA